MDKLNQSIKTLREWGHGQKKPIAYFGICGNLVHMRALPEAAIYTSLGEAFLSWPKYSGNRGYPIPDPEASSDLGAACGIFYSHPNLWEDSPYGNLRRELCLHIADWLEANKAKVLPLFEGNFHD